MVQLKNAGPKAITKEIQDKKLYFFGAGRSLGNCLDVYCQNKTPEAVVDNNEALWGTAKTLDGREARVIGVKDFLKELERTPLEQVVLIITAVFYGAEIVEQLDGIPELDGLTCYLHAIVRNTAEPMPAFAFSAGEQKIPKKIHYFWVGGHPLPARLQKCVDSWRRFNPDYEIIRWDESNYDFTKVDYMREAYENKAWGFATDYARLDVVYQYGGIYLDTDVEVLRSLDVLLRDEAFFGAGSADHINTGVGFGAVPQCELVKAMRDYYHDKHFIGSNRAVNLQYQNPVFTQYGFRIANEYQRINDMVIYSAEVLSPSGTVGWGNFFSDKTISIHHNEYSWIAENERIALRNLKEMASTRLGIQF